MPRVSDANLISKAALSCLTFYISTATLPNLFKFKSALSLSSQLHIGLENIICRQDTCRHVGR